VARQATRAARVWAAAGGGRRGGGDLADDADRVCEGLGLGDAHGEGGPREAAGEGQLQPGRKHEQAQPNPNPKLNRKLDPKPTPKPKPKPYLSAMMTGMQPAAMAS